MTASIIYIPHGGGPMPLLEDPGHEQLTAFLTTAGAQLPMPRAVVVISAHWEAAVPTVTTGDHPRLIYDYYDFPPKAYDIKYPAPGDPGLAAKVLDVLTGAGIKAESDPGRGFDHGLFVPLALMLPKADIPCIQVSLCSDLDPLRHLQIGEALAPLLGENIWLLGSGFSFHNLRAFGGGNDRDTDPRNLSFQDWLSRTCTGKGLSPEMRKEALIQWANAPHARFCHPREEHPLPLMVCAGAAGYSRATPLFDGEVLGRRALAFLWK